MPTEKQIAILREYERRQNVKKSMADWARLCGFEPAAHHRLILAKMESASKKRDGRLIVCMPPGSAKSTYISKLSPAWFIAQRPGQAILACSYSKDLIQGFGRAARNYIAQHSATLEFGLRSDTKAADEWETTNGGRYFCAGVNAGIAGHRADIAYIDDPIGSDEDARSQNYRDKQWSWFRDDFMPRLKPGGSVIIIANRRHEDDLVGRLISTEGEDWEVIRLPLVIDTPAQREADPLRRGIGERLWPEWFTERMVAEARRSENFSGLYQQEPSPEEGDLIKREWLVEHHNPNEYPPVASLRMYFGSDHALTTREENDSHALIPGGLDMAGDLWIQPDCYWEQSDTGVLVDKMIDFGRRYQIVQWWAENEHILKAVGPFLRKRMLETRVFLPITGLTSSKDLVSRSSSIRGFLRLRKVHFPAWTKWWPLAKHQLLSFPKAKHDDFVAGLSELGQGLASMTSPQPPPPDPFVTKLERGWRPTVGWMKRSDRMKRLARQYGDR